MKRQTRALNATPNGRAISHLVTDKTLTKMRLVTDLAFAVSNPAWHKVGGNDSVIIEVEAHWAHGISVLSLTIDLANSRKTINVRQGPMGPRNFRVVIDNKAHYSRPAITGRRSLT